MKAALDSTQTGEDAPRTLLPLSVLRINVLL